MKETSWMSLLRRLGDVLVSVVLIVVLSPIMLAAAVMIIFDGTDGGIFADAPQRVGKAGTLFTMFKFRTMIPDAHSFFDKEIGKGKSQTRDHMKIPSDSDQRITKIGRVLRKTDVDELPQLFNVLLGDMSIVGPRPYFEEELKSAVKERIADQQLIDTILSVKPGITGLWQVSGRNDISFKGRMEMDAEYVRARSVFSDLGILLKTPLTVLSRKGAW